MDNLHITTEQYISALKQEGVLKERSVELLYILYDAPNCEATAKQIAQIFGYNDFPPVNALIGKLGKRIANNLNIQLNERPGKSSPGWWQVIANGEYKPDGFTWSLKDELFEALVDLGLLRDYETKLYPEIIPDLENLSEGYARIIYIDRYERNLTARKICIQHYGAICSACNFNFEETYGDIGKGFIHVHHLVEISAIRKEYKVNPIDDLRPVCPNCHAMLHQKRPAYSIEELKHIMSIRSK